MSIANGKGDWCRINGQGKTVKNERRKKKKGDKQRKKKKPVMDSKSMRKKIKCLRGNWVMEMDKQEEDGCVAGQGEERVTRWVGDKQQFDGNNGQDMTMTRNDDAQDFCYHFS